MIRISNIRIDISLKNKDSDLISWKINKKSIDARRKNRITYQYSVAVEVEDEDSVLNKSKKGKVSKISEKQYIIKSENISVKDKPPVIIGAGPSGLFCALILAENNLRPIIIEQGKKVEERVKDIDEFWKNGELNLKSNVQFGEGGAGTFSDGKLTTLVKDKENRSLKIIEEFIKAGAPEEISYIKN